MEIHYLDIPSRYLLVQSQQRKHQYNVWNLFKANNKDGDASDVVRVSLLLTLNRFHRLFWCFLCQLLTSKWQLGWKQLYHCTKNKVFHFFRKCDHIRSFLRIWSHLLKKSLIFCEVLSLGTVKLKNIWRYLSVTIFCAVYYGKARSWWNC